MPSTPEAEAEGGDDAGDNDTLCIAFSSSIAAGGESTQEFTPVYRDKKRGVEI